MGKRSKQGASLRAKKRADATHQQLERVLSERGEERRVQSKADEELFVLDTDRTETAASRRALAARRASDKDASKKRKYEHSEREMRRIKRTLELHGKEGAIALAERGRARLEGKRARRRASAAAAPTFDLWDEPPVPDPSAGKELPTASPDPDFDPPPRPAARLSGKQLRARRRAAADAPPRLAVEVAHPGQSYRPDGEHHQDAIGEALSIEIRRNEAEEYRSRPVGEGMTAFTKSCIVESDDEDGEEESSDEEEGNDGAGAGPAKIIKRKERLTRAQRNKQKRVKAEQTSLKERRRQKQFRHQANEVHVHNRAVKQAEKEQRERRLLTARLKSEKKAKPLGKDVWTAISAKDPIRAPALPVALTEELRSKDGAGGGGLRTVTPKGMLVTDRLESMVARNMISKKKTEGRRVVQGKKRPKRRGGKGTEYLLM